MRNGAWNEWGKRKEQSTEESNRSFHPVLPTEPGIVGLRDG